MDHWSRCYSSEDALLQGGEQGIVGPRLEPHAVGGATVLLQDNHVLGDVDEPAGEVAAVRRPQSCIGQALSSSVGGYEVLQGCEPLTEAGLDGPVNDAALGVAHQAPEPRHLLDLGYVALGPGDSHEGHSAEVGQVLLHHIFHVVRGLGPSGDSLVVSLLLGHQPHHVLLFVLLDLAVGFLDDIRFLG